MSTLHLDHIKGSPQSEMDSEGWVYVERCARVTDVGGIGTKKHLNALKVSGMPSIGDEHPSIAVMKVTRFRFETIDDTTVDVYPVYERRDDTDYLQIDGDAYTMPVETNRNPDGSLIELEFGGKKQSGTITIDLQGLRYTVQRRETVEPDNLAARFVGTYNSGAWNMGGQPMAATPGMWKCSSYTWTSSDNQETWDSTIVFEMAPWRPDGTATWAQEVTYLDSETGRIPDGVIDGSDMVKGKAIKSIAAGPLVDFNGLHL